MEVRTGIGFSIVTALDPWIEGLAVLVACTVTVFGAGSEAGGVYRPLALIVPKVELPPAIPLTAQVTVAGDSAVTFAVNCCEAPKRTLAVPGVVTTPGIGELLVSPVHPPAAMQRTARTAMTPDGAFGRSYP